MLLVFAALMSTLPLASALKIGADEGFELAKSVLSLNGHRFYTEVWNDQPPLHVFLLTWIAEWISPSILWPRLLTVFCSAGLLVSVVILGSRCHSLAAGVLAATWLLASPGFLELSCSVMQEIPALAPAIGCLAVLAAGWRQRPAPAVALAGALYGVALQMKLIGAIYLPLALALIWMLGREPDRAAAGSASESDRRAGQGVLRTTTRMALVFTAAALVAFVGVLLLAGETRSYLFQLKQSWFAHFAAMQSAEYGSADQHPFGWGVLARNWDATLPTVVALALVARGCRQKGMSLFPAAWLILMLGIFGVHRPWWSYYYVHTAVPLSLCAGIAIAETWALARLRRTMLPKLAVAVFVVAASLWMGGRIYLQASSIRALPPIHSSQVLREVARLRPHVRFMFTDEPIYSFHTKIPLPPALGVLSLKRFWSGDMTNARLTAELRKAQPELLLLKNDTTELPFDDLIRSDYRLIYYDDRTRLFGLKEMLLKADY